LLKRERKNIMQFKAPSFVTVDGRRLAYDEVCPPDPQGTVLLLTGLAAKRQGWYQQIDVFGQTYRTIALDHRDIGDSDPFSAPYGIADQADDAADALKALGVSQAAVVGISMGGFIALEFTLRHPEMVGRLVLTSTSAGGPSQVQAEPQFLALLVRPRDSATDIGVFEQETYALIMAPGYADSHPDDMEHIAAIARYRPQAEESYRRQLMACLGHDVAQRLGEIHVPTLVVHGTNDPLIPVENGNYLAQHISNARLILYSGTGHVPIIERAEDYNRDVLTFLRGDL
jgi:pimeloyl-ACP methyl ester carboxylesterase